MRNDRIERHRERERKRGLFAWRETKYIEASYTREVDDTPLTYSMQILWATYIKVSHLAISPAPSRKEARSCCVM